MTMETGFDMSTHFKFKTQRLKTIRSVPIIVYAEQLSVMLILIQLHKPSASLHALRRPVSTSQAKLAFRTFAIMKLFLYKGVHYDYTR